MEKNSNPIILIEVEERHREGSVTGVHSMLAGLGYRCFFMRGKELLPFSEFRLEKHQDSLKKRSNVRNFIYIHTDDNRLAGTG